MHHTQLVGSLYGLQHATGDDIGLLQGERPVSQVPVEAGPIDELHHQGRGAAGLHHVGDLHHVGVPQRALGLPFPEQARLNLRRLHRQHLHGVLAAELVVAHAVHHRHAPATQQAQDGVAVYLGAVCKLHGADSTGELVAGDGEGEGAPVADAAVVVGHRVGELVEAGGPGASA